MKTVTAIIIGAGHRGNIYGSFALNNPSKLQILAVAEIQEPRRNIFATIHKIPKHNCFSNWKEIIEQDKLAHTAIISTPDQIHVEPAIAAMEKGYHVLLEKPMAVTINDCITLIKKAEKLGRILQISHVLRYTKFFSTIYRIINTGKIGKIVNISMRENLSYFHYAHSYIRGNWHNREKSSPMILSKCCHDFDFLYWIINSNPTKISSFGSLTSFKSQIAPKDTPIRCLDGCPIENSCLYFAPNIYLNIIPLLHATKIGGSIIDKFISKLALKYPKLKKFPPFNKINQYSGWPINVITEDISLKGKLKALKKGPYGKCVYHIKDHNVVDRQVVNIEFENKVTATLTMHGHAHEEGRTIRIDGTKGTIIGEFLLSKQQLTVFNSLRGTNELIFQKGMEGGHGGGDDRLMEYFINTVRAKQENQKIIPLTDAQTSLMSHIMAFAADKARIENIIINPLELLNDK